MNAQAGFTAHTTTLGQGARRVLALHCTMAFGGAWGAVAKALPDTTLIAPDMASHGRSADWDENSDFGDTTFAASLAAMDDTPMDVIGHSFGAAIALRMAVEHPERIRSLTLFEPVFFAVARADAPEMLVHHDTLAKPFDTAMKSGDRAAAARAFNGMWADSAAWDALSDRSRAAMTRAIHVVPNTKPFLYEDLCGLLVEGVLEAVTIPTVVMRSEHTLPAVRATTAGLARRLGNASEVTINGAGHMGPITHPVEVAASISELFSRS